MAISVEWPVRLQLVEESGTTTARVELRTRAATFTGHGPARRTPEDRDVPESGGGIAGRRARRGRPGQLLRVADDDLEDAGAAPPRHETRTAYGWTDALA